MRVLLALDGSAASDSARRLVGSLSWPEGSVINVVGVVEPIVDVFGGLNAYPGAAAELEPAAQEGLAAVLDDACEALRAPGLIVRRAVVIGRPASVILDEALALRAELIVVGSRGLGPIKSMLLGSVSDEVVDHAPCPVLVVRSARVASILIGVDGSAASSGAVAFLTGTPVFRGRPVEVLAVGARFRPVASLDLGRRSTSGTPDVLVDREHTEATAAAAAGMLSRQGYQVRWSVAAGDPADEIIEAASSFGSDLIVLGSRGMSGLDRVLLGSVSRNVLLHAPASVLIVREPIRERASEPATEESRSSRVATLAMS